MIFVVVGFVATNTATTQTVDFTEFVALLPLFPLISYKY
jgi:hypothetical protein